MPEKLYVGYYIRGDGNPKYHLSRNGRWALCGLGPCDKLEFLPSLWPVHRALKVKHVRTRGCKTCKKIARGLQDAITRLGNLARHEG